MCVNEEASLRPHISDFVDALRYLANQIRDRRPDESRTKNVEGCCYSVDYCRSFKVMWGVSLLAVAWTVVTTSGGSLVPQSQHYLVLLEIECAVDLLADWIYECCGSVSFSSLEHPKFRAFLNQVGLPPASRRELAGSRLDVKYEEVKVESKARIRDAMFFSGFTRWVES
ncbi:hypothetical protein V6N13_001213 [Hibiscus sabdariffa]